MIYFVAKSELSFSVFPHMTTYSAAFRALLRSEWVARKKGEKLLSLSCWRLVSNKTGSVRREEYFFDEFYMVHPAVL
jgi:hypothetical protein